MDVFDITFARPPSSRLDGWLDQGGPCSGKLTSQIGAGFDSWWSSRNGPMHPFYSCTCHHAVINRQNNALIVFSMLWWWRRDWIRYDRTNTEGGLAFNTMSFSSKTVLNMLQLESKPLRNRRRENPWQCCYVAYVQLVYQYRFGNLAWLLE